MQLTDLSIGYPDHVVMSGINAQLMPGELTCLIGRNGAGKSTLMRTMAAFQKPLKGTITIPPTQNTPATAIDTPATVKDGSAISTHTFLTPKTRSRLISVVLTERPDIQDMTIRDMVAMGRAPYTGFFGILSKKDNAIIDEALKLVGLFLQTNQHPAQTTNHQHLPPTNQHPTPTNQHLTPTTLFSTLSDGERQKVMIAKALAQQTPYIFLDEPTAFLDYPTKIEMMQMLQRLCHDQHKAILLSTHDLDIALRHCDRVWHMQHNTLTICQPTTDLLNII